MTLTETLIAAEISVNICASVAKRMLIGTEGLTMLPIFLQAQNLIVHLIG